MGGAHAGNGGVGYYGEAGGFGGYGSIIEPQTCGSAGGTSSAGPGGNGGGAIKIVVGGTLTVDGALTANGANGVSNNSGGGAGGSIWATTEVLTGAGTISANGGNGERASDGGGGGGGRIAIHDQQNTFVGALCASGGSGTQHGGAGTIFRKASAAPYGSLRIDNQGLAGTTTPLRTPQAFHLALAGNAQVYPLSGEALLAASLDIDSNAQLSHLTGQKLVVHVLQDTYIRATGQIHANAVGYPSGGNIGPGHGSLDTDSGSGGGYGGAGGHNYWGLTGGGTYGSESTPESWGSAGAPGDNNGVWCPGGGSIRLNVGGILTVDGVIASDGSAAFRNDQGGGSGGSVWLSVHQLTGLGRVSAKGGNGESDDGGGGGGGRIAVYQEVANGFDHSRLQVPGGSGSQTGGIGTVFLGNSMTNEVPVVQSMFPSDTVLHWVDSVDVSFNTTIAADSFTTDDVRLTTPAGSVPTSQLSVIALTPQVFRIGFPLQTISGSYSLQIGPNVTNAFSTPMATAFTGSFAINASAHTLTLTSGVSSLTVSWPTQVGIFYLLESSEDLSHWSKESDWVLGLGTSLQQTYPISGPRRFFRLAAKN